MLAAGQTRRQCRFFLSLGYLSWLFYYGNVVELILYLTVRRQSFWHQELRKLSESLAHLVGLIMRRVVCDASVAFRSSYV